MYELSLVELESELSAELPARTLMSRRRSHARASANFGSVANANATNQTISNPQTAALFGLNTDPSRPPVQVNAALVAQLGLNHNDNTNTQFGVPENFNAN